jgi:hypothetical protein
VHLGVAAAVGERADAVPQRKVHGGHGIRVSAYDSTGYFEPRKITGSGRRVIVAFPLKHVGAVDATGNECDSTGLFGIEKTGTTWRQLE